MELKMKLRESIKYGVIYIALIGSLINNWYHLKAQGIHMGSYLFQISNKTMSQQFLKDVPDFWVNYGYVLTRVKVGEPFSLVVNVVPYLKMSQTFMGYIEDNEIALDATSLSQEQEIFLSNTIPSKQQEIPELEQYKDYYYVLKNYMTGDGSLNLDIDILKEWNFYELMQKDIAIDETVEGPKILIFHTHARESYIGGQTVVDVGEALKTALEEKYGMEVLHVTEEFYAEDNLEGGVDGTEYEIMEPRIKEILAANPSIQVAMDIHRDGVSESTHLVTDIHGKQTAKVMFVNGLCLHRNSEGEIIHKEGLQNPYLEDNLAFSMQTQTMGNAYYPGLLRKIYCKEYRYSSHMCPNSLVLEIGAQTNTGEEALNAVEPLADILAKVLQKD